MQGNYFIDETFSRISLLEAGEYENCTFKGCDFSNQDFSWYKFVECEFIECNLSMVKLYESTLREVDFKGCKLLGLRFDACNQIGLSVGFDDCQLNNASFFKTKIKKTKFLGSNLQEVDFAESDLSEALFDNCDLSRATFDQTNLEKADFSTAYGFMIDPELNRVKKAKFSITGLNGLLERHQIVVI